METQGISVLGTNSNLEKRLENITRESYCMKISLALEPSIVCSVVVAHFRDSC